MARGGRSVIRQHVIVSIGLRLAPGDDDGECSSLYDPDVLQSFAIEMSDGDWRSMYEEYIANDSSKNYRSVVFHRTGPDGFRRWQHTLSSSKRERGRKAQRLNKRSLCATIGTLAPAVLISPLK